MPESEARGIETLKEWLELREQQRQLKRNKQPVHAGARIENPPPESGLSIVIPTYNALGVVEPLLRQLAQMPEVCSGDYEVILTDDASTDGTVAKLRQGFPQFRYVESDFNSGFGPNANRGIFAAQKGYVALVNTDVELVGDVFPQLIASLSQNRDCFAVMPLVYNTALRKVENLQRLDVKRGLVWNADLPQAPGFSAPIRHALETGATGTALLGGISEMQPQTSILCGACFVASWAALWKLGGFDERFAPFYWEDVDLGFAGCHVLGWYAEEGVKVVPTTLVLHRHSESINRKHGRRKYRFLRLNQLRFALKWSKRLQGIDLQSWILLRAVRECFGGDPVMCLRYFKVWRRMTWPKHGNSSRFDVDILMA